MVYFGDNEVRDVRPAQKEGVLAITIRSDTGESFQRSRHSEYLLLGHLADNISG